RSAGAPACVGRALTSRMTRPSSAGSIWRGRRRCRAMRSITSSIGSNTLGLFQHRLELLARPLDAHLQRGDTRAGEPRHVLVLELLDMLEEERLSRVGRETRSEEHTSNSSHVSISYAVFCLKKKNLITETHK